MDKKVEEKLIEKDLEQIPEHKRFVTKKFTMLCLVALLVLFGVGTGFFLFHKKQPTKTVIAPVLKRSDLSGHIIYGDKNGWEEMDVKTGEITPLFKSFGYDWVYKNGYIFVSSTSSVMRFSLKTKHMDTISVETLGAPQINPSPDGEKVYVYNAPGYPGDPTPAEIFLYNFVTHQKIQFPNGRWGYMWMSDSRHMLTDSLSSMPVATVYDGAYSHPLKLFIWDTEANTTTQIAEGTFRGIAIDPNKPVVSWLIYNGEHFPSFYTTTINLKDNSIGKILKVSGLTMPIARDYFTGISAAISGGGQNEFYLSVDNKKFSVYFTNSQDIFKKISPVNDYSYRAVMYNDTFDKVVAFKFPAKLYPGNMPPYLVFLDKKGSSEKLITNLWGFIPESEMVFSPDGKYLLTPKSEKSDYTIFSLANPQTKLLLKENLGNKFYWIK